LYFEYVNLFKNSILLKIIKHLDKKYKFQNQLLTIKIYLIIKMETFIINSFNIYFNSVLKNVLKYTDIFTINVDINNKTISLRSNLENSELSKMLNIDHKLLNKINTQLLSAFIKNNPNIGYVNILLYTDGIIIKCDYSFDSIKDIGPLFEITKNLDFKEL